MCVRSSDSLSNGYTPPLSNKHIFHSTFSLDAPLVPAHFWTLSPLFQRTLTARVLELCFCCPPWRCASGYWCLLTTGALTSHVPSPTRCAVEHCVFVPLVVQHCVFARKVRATERCVAMCVYLNKFVYLYMLTYVCVCECECKGERDSVCVHVWK